MTMEQSGFAERLSPGATVAIGAGSRGISNIGPIVIEVVRYWLGRGFRPFVFPAMGSHGAATAVGQIDVLAHYEITEATLGCPIRSSLEVLSLGQTEEGFEVWAGTDAWGADAVMLVNRIKWHTSFSGALESGLTKMMAIGLGKMEGARTAHAASRRHGMEAVIRSVGTKVLGTGKMLGGLAILEDAHHNTAHVEAIPSDILMAREEALLSLTKSWMARLPLRDIDILIVDEIGKNISGTGMDAKVINRGPAAETNPAAQRISCIYVRGLSSETYGSAMGIGMADIIHSRVKESMNIRAGLVNAMTTGTLAQVRVPVDFPSDLECLEIAARTAGCDRVEDARIVWIQNTLQLSRVAVSRNAGLPGDQSEARLDGAGNLTSIFPGAVQ